MPPTLVTKQQYNQLKQQKATGCFQLPSSMTIHLYEGEKHREDGPAVIKSDGRTQEWWKRGRKVKKPRTKQNKPRTYPINARVPFEIGELIDLIHAKGYASKSDVIIQSVIALAKKEGLPTPDNISTWAKQFLIDQGYQITKV